MADIDCHLVRQWLPGTPADSLRRLFRIFGRGLGLLGCRGIGDVEQVGRLTVMAAGLFAEEVDSP